MSNLTDIILDTFNLLYMTKNKNLYEPYLNPFLLSLNKAKTRQEKYQILNKIYEDGFEDGFNERDNEISNEKEETHESFFHEQITKLSDWISGKTQ